MMNRCPEGVAQKKLVSNTMCYQAALSASQIRRSLMVGTEKNNYVFPASLDSLDAGSAIQFVEIM